MANKQLTNLPSNGTSFGQSSADLITFYNGTAVAQPAMSAFAAVATTAAINSSISSSCFGFTSAQANAIVAAVNGIRALLVTLNLGST